MFRPSYRVMTFGTSGTGKTSLLRKLIGDESPVLPTTEIQTMLTRIRFKNKNYKILLIDTPGDFTLRRFWRMAMIKNAPNVLLFLLDPSQDVIAQKSIFESAFDFFLDSLDVDPRKADRKALQRSVTVLLVVNKSDLLSSSGDSQETETKSKTFLGNFQEHVKTYNARFPRASFSDFVLSVKQSSLQSFDEILESIITAPG